MKTAAKVTFGAVLLGVALLWHCGDGGTVVEADDDGGAGSDRDARTTEKQDASGPTDTSHPSDASDSGTADAWGADTDTGDAGTTDADAADGGTDDAGNADGGAGDSGTADVGDDASGPADASDPSDTSYPSDTGDAGQDGGAPDAGQDAGAPDSGVPDAGPFDGGTGDAGPAGPGRFGIGIHSTRPDFNQQVTDLGDIFVRLNLWDVVGWKNIKGAAGIAECQSCCDPARSPNCLCANGSYYYCTPQSRNNLVLGENLSDTFYPPGHDILFSVGPGDYGQNQPASPDDLVAEEYPADEQTYREYLAYLVQQYPNAEYWEMGNEANYPKFWDDTTPNYARLISLSAGHIKGLCPACKVGLSLSSTDPGASWFNAMTGVCDDVDFLDLHHYQASNMTELSQFEANGITAWQTACPGKEIVSTETGLPSVPVTFKGKTWQLGTSEQKQAEDTIKYFTMMFKAGYRAIYNYIVDHDFLAGQPDIYESIGVLRMDGTKKPSFSTYLVMIAKLDRFVSITKLSAGQYKYAFADKNPVYVLWCDSGGCAINSEVSGTVKVTDYLGNEQTRSAGQIVLNGSPIFVESGP